MLTASHFGPATYPVLNSHMWLVATDLDTAALDQEAFYCMKPDMFPDPYERTGIAKCLSFGEKHLLYR